MAAVFYDAWSLTELVLMAALGVVVSTTVIPCLMLCMWRDIVKAQKRVFASLDENGTLWSNISCGCAAVFASGILKIYATIIIYSTVLTAIVVRAASHPAVRMWVRSTVRSLLD